LVLPQDGCCARAEQVHCAARVPEAEHLHIRYVRTLYVYSAEDRATLRNILERPLHALKREEIKTLSAHLGYYYDDDKLFKISTARTEVLNGRRVAIIEGVFLEDAGPGARAYAVIFTNSAGDSPREVSFWGPAPLFTKYWGDVRRMLDAIRWDE
jgi:hypothetical protein